MSANQLLEKALSTTSEDEAIACLKMARKKGLKLTTAKTVNMDAFYEKELASTYRTIHSLEREKDKMSEEIDHFRAISLCAVISFITVFLFILAF